LGFGRVAHNLTKRRIRNGLYIHRAGSGDHLVRQLALWLVILASAWAAAQTTAAVLHNRHVEPNREEMQVRPGVSITVQMEHEDSIGEN
jgi:hypothetical protein